MRRPCENLSRYQRRATPIAFARYLVDRVKSEFCCDRVAVLWTERRSPYWKLYPSVELYGLGRNALTYAGPYPVICHPPCGPWGKYKAVSHESRLHGAAAIAIVHKFGGVIEQPLGSTLFREMGDGRTVERVNQLDYGHASLKPTILYWCFPHA